MGQFGTCIGRSAALRRTYGILGVLVVSIFAMALAVPSGQAASGPGWHPQFDSDGSGGMPYAIAFANASDGWAVGDNAYNYGGVSTIMATTDGGATWKAKNSDIHSSLLDVACVSAKTAWAVAGDIFATTDGGATWQTQYSPTYSYPGVISPSAGAIAFANASDGWAVGRRWINSTTAEGSILATTNGGATWSVQSVPTGASDLQDVAFANASDGWAVGHSSSTTAGGIILATTDGGATWVAQTVPAGPYALWHVACTDTSHCWAVGYNTNTNEAVFLATTNGGTTWALKPLPSALAGFRLDSIAFASASNGWAVGYDESGTGIGAVLATTDGGNTWTMQWPTPTMEAMNLGELTDVACVDSTHAWAAGTYLDGGNGRHGSILATTNGGSAPPYTPQLMLTLVSFRIKYGKSVTAVGEISPRLSLAGSKVTLKAQSRKGARWVRAKAGSASIGRDGIYRWTFKPRRRGSYRIKATIAKTAAHNAATSTWVRFKVK
jgi:photosystem II stability/assembly factor-like uncharacterized protein